MIIVTHHRSWALATRKWRQLQRQYFRVELLSRRNESGRYSSHGRTYVWEIEQGAKKTEYVIHFDYGALSKKRGDQRIRFQVHVFGPGNVRDAEVVRIIRARNEGEPWPKGWRKRAIFWGKPKGDAQTCVHRTDPIPSELREVSIAGGSASSASHCRLSKESRK